MTISTTTSRANYTGNGVTIVFPIPFRFLVNTDLVVELVDVSGVSTTLVLDSGYTLSGADDEDGGTLTMAVAPATGERLIIRRVVPATQETDYISGGPFPAETHERALDKLTMLVQQILDTDDRAILIPSYDPPGINVTLPDAATRANRILSFDAEGNVSVTIPEADSSAELRIELADTVDPTKGATLVGFRQSGTGATARTVATKLRERKTPEDFGAAGDGVTDDTAELQALFLAHLDIDLGGPDKNYRISDTINLRTGHRIIGHGATITQVTADTEIFNMVAKSDISCEGVNFVGVGTDYNETDSLRASAFFGGTSGSNIRICGNKFTNFGYSAARFEDQDDIYFCDNVVVGPGAPTLTPITSGRNYGVLFDSTCERVTCTGNTISGHAQGIRVEQCIGVRIANNHLFDIVGQHGVYAGPNNNLVIEGNTIRNVNLIGIKVQAQNLVGECRDVTIIGNSITTAGDQGILLCNSGGSSAQTNKVRGATVMGNVLRAIASSGINLQNAVGGLCSGNNIDGVLTSGIVLSSCSYVTVDSNVVLNVGLSGIRDEAANDNCIISNNRLHNVAQDSTANDEYGIYLNAGGSYSVHHNIVSDSNAKMEYGIYVTTNVTHSGCEVYDNTVLNTVTTGGRFDGSQTMRRFSGNSFASGSSGAVQGTPLIPTVASASAITIPGGSDVVLISGTTTINTINSGRAGERVTLVFLDALTVVRSGTLLLNAAAGNFVTTGGDTLTLAFGNNTQCYEISRSAN